MNHHIGISECRARSGIATITDNNGDTINFPFKGEIFGYSGEIVASYDGKMIHVYDHRGRNISSISFYGTPKAVSENMIAAMKGNMVIIYDKRGNELRRFEHKPEE